MSNPCISTLSWEMYSSGRRELAVRSLRSGSSIALRVRSVRQAGIIANRSVKTIYTSLTITYLSQSPPVRARPGSPAHPPNKVARSAYIAESIRGNRDWLGWVNTGLDPSRKPTPGAERRLGLTWRYCLKLAPLIARG